MPVANVCSHCNFLVDKTNFCHNSKWSRATVENKMITFTANLVFVLIFIFSRIEIIVESEFYITCCYVGDIVYVENEANTYFSLYKSCFTCMLLQ